MFPRHACIVAEFYHRVAGQGNVAVNGVAFHAVAVEFYVVNKPEIAVSDQILLTFAAEAEIISKTKFKPLLKVFFFRNVYHFLLKRVFLDLGILPYVCPLFCHRRIKVKTKRVLFFGIVAVAARLNIKTQKNGFVKRIMQVNWTAFYGVARRKVAVIGVRVKIFERVQSVKNQNTRTRRIFSDVA